MISASNIHYEIADRTRGISAGGIGMIHQMVKRLQLDKAINRAVPLFKIYLPYCESDPSGQETQTNTLTLRMRDKLNA
jgi:hypothetical protein